MSPDEDRILDEAVAWHAALAADDADWERYAAWLEADPRHRAAFDEIALVDRIVDEHAVRRPAPALAPPAATPRRRRWFAAGPAVAAAVVAVALVLPSFTRPAPDVVFASAAGAARHVALAGGTAIDLAPGSRLIARHGDPTALELARGEAFFTVRHDPRRTLTVSAGGFAITDIGTRFGIGVGAGRTSVAVAEGRLAFATADGSRTTLRAGQRIVADGAAATAVVSPIDPARVGGWRRGRLAYDGTPLTVVAADLERYVGKPIAVDPALRDRTFSGVLVVGDGSGLVRDLTSLMAISYRADGGAIRLVDDASR